MTLESEAVSRGASRQEMLNDRRIAEVTVPLSAAESLIDALRVQLEDDSNIGAGYVRHSAGNTTDKDIERVKKALAEIQNAAKKRDSVCTIPLSGQEVLALDRFTLGRLSGVLAGIGDSYLQNPEKREPRKKSEILGRLLRRRK